MEESLLHQKLSELSYLEEVCTLQVLFRLTLVILTR